MHPHSLFSDTAHCCCTFCPIAFLCPGKLRHGACLVIRDRWPWGWDIDSVPSAISAFPRLFPKAEISAPQNLPAPYHPQNKQRGRKPHSTHCSSYMSLCFSEFLPQPLCECCNRVLGGTVKMHHRLWHHAVPVHAEERAEREVLRWGRQAASWEGTNRMVEPPKRTREEMLMWWLCEEFCSPTPL